MGKLRQIAELVQPIFQKMGWEYYDTDGIPSLEVLKNTLKMIKKDVKRVKGRVEYGRFMAEPGENCVRFFLELEIPKVK